MKSWKVAQRVVRRIKKEKEERSERNDKEIRKQKKKEKNTHIQYRRESGPGIRNQKNFADISRVCKQEPQKILGFPRVSRVSRDLFRFPGLFPFIPGLRQRWNETKTQKYPKTQK